MAYKVIYSEGVEKDLRRIDRRLAAKILVRIETYLAKNPKELGLPLKGQYGGAWRYRWGVYRVIYRISDEEIMILVLRISHRKDVYSR